jgi:hypothetical protein
MNMEMILMMMALGSSSGGSSTSGLTETLLYTSDMLPQMPRMLLAMNSAKAATARHDQEVTDLKKMLAGQVYAAVKKMVGADPSSRLKLAVDLGASSELVAILQEHLTPTQFDEIIDRAL